MRVTLSYCKVDHSGHARLQPSEEQRQDSTLLLHNPYILPVALYSSLLATGKLSTAQLASDPVECHCNMRCQLDQLLAGARPYPKQRRRANLGRLPMATAQLEVPDV
jgi:hypothetical protein